MLVELRPWFYHHRDATDGRRGNDEDVTMTEYTWGVYLRPDPITCKAIADLTELAKRQFGIVSAAAFAPHATLAGAVPSNASAEDFIAALDPLLVATPAFPVFNAGIGKLTTTIIYDIDRTPSGEKNIHLQDLATAVNEAIAPLTAYVPGEWTQPFGPATFHAHFSLASHDLRDRPDLAAEVEEFLRAIPMDIPPTFMADTITLFRFHSADWNSTWWHDLTWQHVRSWKLITP